MQEASLPANYFLFKVEIMRGLRVYIIVGEAMIFYSQRDGGPYYRWRFAEEAKSWRCSRVRPNELDHKELYFVVWKSLPKTLCQTLDGHYLD